MRLTLVLCAEAVLEAVLGPLVASDPTPPRYVVRRTAQAPEALLGTSDARWSDAQRISWGPESIATALRALWTDAGLAVRTVAPSSSPWSVNTAGGGP